MISSLIFGILLYALPLVCLAVVTDAIRRSSSRRIVAASEILFILSLVAEFLRHAAVLKPGLYLIPNVEDFILAHQWLVTSRDFMFALACLLLAIWAVGLSKRLRSR